MIPFPLDLPPEPPLPGDVAPGAPEARAPWIKPLGHLAAAAAIVYGAHRGFNSDLPVVGNFSEHAGDASEVAEVAVMSGTLAIYALRRHIRPGISGARRYRASRKLDKLENQESAQFEVVEDAKRVIQGVESGGNVVDVNAAPGTVLPADHDRIARKRTNKRVKAHRFEHEVKGLERIAGLPLGSYLERVDDARSPTPPEDFAEIVTRRGVDYYRTAETPYVVIRDKDGIVHKVPVAVSDIGTEIHHRRVDLVPRTAIERDEHKRMVTKHHHETHKARKVERKASREPVEGREKRLAELTKRADKVGRQLERQGGWVDRLEDHPTRLGRSYSAAKHGTRTAKRAARALISPVKSMYHFFRD